MHRIELPPVVLNQVITELAMDHPISRTEGELLGLTQTANLALAVFARYWEDCIFEEFKDQSHRDAFDALRRSPQYLLAMEHHDKLQKLANRWGNEPDKNWLLDFLRKARDGYLIT